MLHLIVGNTGAGKTTYAKQFQKKNGGIIFSIDQWNNTLFMPDRKEEDGLDWFLERIEREEELMMKLIIQLEEQSIDSILDLGLSKYDHRQKFRDFAKDHGFAVKLHYLKVGKEERWTRIQQRNSEKGDSFEFEVSRSDFDFMEEWFETPKEDEMEN